MAGEGDFGNRARRRAVLSASPATMPAMDVLLLVGLIIGLGLGTLVGHLLSQGRSSASLAALRTELESTRVNAARELETARRHSAEQLETARMTQEHVREMFAALSSDAL